MLDLIRLTGSAAAALREVLFGLQVDAEKMRADVALTHGLIMSESVISALAPMLGRTTAHELVREATGRAASDGRDLKDTLLEAPEVAGAIGEDALDRALDPSGYLGATRQLIDRALGPRRTQQAS